MMHTSNYITEDKMQIKLGEKLRELRQRDGRTQEDLAQALGVTAQAVSRWEKGICYPDMELLPSIANYFGVSIDNLFGYNNEREKKINEIVGRINEMNLRNNGRDECLDECIRLAREALVEFPGNETIMLCLASALYNAGYVRYGEYHLIDSDGYNVYDTDRHRTYPEWTEAIKLYEKLLTSLNEGEMRCQAIRELSQLYLNTGEYDRALAIADIAPRIRDSREFLRINACDGKLRAKACGEALLKTADAYACLIINGLHAYEQNITPTEKVECIQNAIRVFDLICTDGNYGQYNAIIARMYTLLSLYLWLDKSHDEAFHALDKSLEHFKMYQTICSNDNATYTAPLLKLVNIETQSRPTNTASLSDDWPWWYVQEYHLVKDEIQSDPRWAEWVKKTKE